MKIYTPMKQLHLTPEIRTYEVRIQKSSCFIMSYIVEFLRVAVAQSLRYLDYGLNARKMGFRFATET
jgi:hypothetical protein